MKVLHVIPSLSPKHGGTSSLIPLMAGSLANAGLKVDVATTDDDGPGHRFEDLTNQRVERDGYGVYYSASKPSFIRFPCRFGNGSPAMCLITIWCMFT